MSTYRYTTHYEIAVTMGAGAEDGVRVVISGTEGPAIDITSQTKERALAFLCDHIYRYTPYPMDGKLDTPQEALVTRKTSMPEPCPEWPECDDDEGPCYACSQYASWLDGEAS